MVDAQTFSGRRNICFPNKVLPFGCIPTIRAVSTLLIDETLSLHMSYNAFVLSCLHLVFHNSFLCAILCLW